MAVVHRGDATRLPRNSGRWPAPVVVKKVDTLAWLVAVALADGDEERLRVIDTKTVLVSNPDNDGSLTVRING
jgi:hypothetical protein